jgi:purine-binding chemotaxis protein CheW
VQALLVPVHEDWFAVELVRVREVVPAPALTPLPGAPPALAGVFNLRGDVVPLFDLAALLGLPGGDHGDQVAVTDAGHGVAALRAHGRPDLVSLGAGAGPADLPGAIARYTVEGEGRVATLIDVDVLLDRVLP